MCIKVRPAVGSVESDSSRSGQNPSQVQTPQLKAPYGRNFRGSGAWRTDLAAGRPKCQQMSLRPRFKTVHPYSHLVFDPLWDAQSVKASKSVSYMVRGFHVVNQPYYFCRRFSSSKLRSPSSFRLTDFGAPDRPSYQLASNSEILTCTPSLVYVLLSETLAPYLTSLGIVFSAILLPSSECVFSDK